MGFSKVKSRDLIVAAMNKLKAKKMKISYLRSLGLSIDQLKKSHEQHTKEKLRLEEMVSKQIEKKRFVEFLEQYDKQHTFECLEEVVARYRSRDNPHYSSLRVKVIPTEQAWRVLTRADKNTRTYAKYYQSLTRSFDSAFKDIANIVELDVRRTKAAIDDPAIYKKLTNILVAYSK